MVARLTPSRAAAWDGLRNSIELARILSGESASPFCINESFCFFIFSRCLDSFRSHSLQQYCVVILCAMNSTPQCLQYLKMFIWRIHLVHQFCFILSHCVSSLYPQSCRAKFERFSQRLSLYPK